MSSQAPPQQDAVAPPAQQPPASQNSAAGTPAPSHSQQQPRDEAGRFTKPGQQQQQQQSTTSQNAAVPSQQQEQEKTGEEEGKGVLDMDIDEDASKDSNELLKRLLAAKEQLQKERNEKVSYKRRIDEIDRVAEEERQKRLKIERDAAAAVASKAVDEWNESRKYNSTIDPLSEEHKQMLMKIPDMAVQYGRAIGKTEQEAEVMGKTVLQMVATASKHMKQQASDNAQLAQNLDTSLQESTRQELLRRYRGTALDEPAYNSTPADSGSSSGSTNNSSSAAAPPLVEPSSDHLAPPENRFENVDYKRENPPTERAPPPSSCHSAANNMNAAQAPRSVSQASRGAAGGGGPNPSSWYDYNVGLASLMANPKTTYVEWTRELSKKCGPVPQRMVARASANAAAAAGGGNAPRTAFSGLDMNAFEASANIEPEAAKFFGSNSIPKAAASPKDKWPGMQHADMGFLKCVTDKLDAMKPGDYRNIPQIAKKSVQNQADYLEREGYLESAEYLRTGIRPMV
jgi:hypothetical protein